MLRQGIAFLLNLNISSRMIILPDSAEEIIMEKPIVAAKSPIAVKLAGGREYWWCACGRSAEQPFCDGSHSGTGIEPLGFKPEKNGEYWLCCCKQSKTPPYCDKSHLEVEKE
jgi:CDGSH-type Zn-finger protein